MLEVVFTVSTAKDARQDISLSHSMSSGPGVYNSLEKASLDTLRTAFQDTYKFLPFLRAQNTIINSKDLHLGIDERMSGLAI